MREKRIWEHKMADARWDADGPLPTAGQAVNTEKAAEDKRVDFADEATLMPRTATEAVLREKEFGPKTLEGVPIEMFTDDELRQKILAIVTADTRLQISTLHRQQLILMLAALSLGGTYGGL